MDTSGTAPWSITADLLLLASFGFVAVRLLRSGPRPRPVPWLTIAASGFLPALPEVTARRGMMDASPTRKDPA